MSLAAIRQDDFAQRVGSPWRVRDHPEVTLTLDDVSPLLVIGPWESFSLWFRGPSDAPLGQGTYVLGHDALGSLELFLVPLGPDGEGPRYECIFNRAVSDPIAAGG